MKKKEIITLIEEAKQVFKELDEELFKLIMEFDTSKDELHKAKLNTLSYKTCRGEAMLTTLLSKLEKED